MKNITYIALFLATAFQMSSCLNEFLDVDTESTLTGEQIFSDPEKAYGAIMGIYDEMVNQSFNGRLWIYHGFNNDTEWCLASYNAGSANDNQTAYAVYKYSGMDDFFGSAFSSAMLAVERANVCIDGLRRYGVPTGKTTLKHYLGEALFLRSWIYYELIGHFGNIPARFEVTTQQTIYKERADRDELYKQILADLSEAAELMPWAGTSEQTATVLRPNKAAAKALRARVALAAGGYAYHLYGEMTMAQLSRDPELTVRKTYTIARDECLDIMNNEGKGFILENDFSKIFKDNCAVQVNAGGEPLWELPFKYNQRGNWMVGGGVFHRGPGGSGTISSGADPYTSTSLGGTFGVVASVWYDYDVNDKRRDVSVAPFRWCDGKQELYRPSGMTPGKLRAEWKNPSLEKFSANSNDGITPIILRYADVLLMFAEADNELNGAPTPQAKAALQRVRERAFGNSQADYVDIASASKESFLKAIQDERRLEFVGELTRKQDLIRWNLLKTNMDRTKNDLYELRTLSGKYSDVPAYVFWKYKDADQVEIEWYGLNRGEIAPGTSGQRVTDQTALNNWMVNNGWQNWNSSGNHLPPPATPALWITYSETSGYLSDSIIESLYMYNPDRRQDMPLPSSIIMNSQGALTNAHLGY